MKIIVAVAIVVFGAVLQNVSAQGTLNSKLDTIRSQINVIQEMLATVQELKYDKLAPVLGFMAFGKQNMSRIIQSYYNETDVYVQELAHNSTAEGKDPTSCVATTKSSSQALQTRSSRAFDGCFNITQDWFLGFENMLEANIREAMNMTSYLNLILSSCSTTNLGDIEPCIDAILPNAMQFQVETYRTTTVTALENRSNFLLVQDQTAYCYNAAEDAMERSWHTIKLDFAKCVSAL